MEKEINYAEIAEETMKIFDARKAESAKKAEDLKTLTEKIRAEEKEKADAEAKTWLESKGVATHMKTAKKGDGDGADVEAFNFWMRTGDRGAAKSLIPAKADKWGMSRETIDELMKTDAGRKALQEDTAGEGGYLVPDDFVAKIISKRDNLSFVRDMGIQVIKTSRDKIDLPGEGTSLAKFSRTAEEAAYTTNDPSFIQNQVTIHKWTKRTLISDELLEDNATNMEEWYGTAVARAMAQTEAYYVAVGSGTNQHEGIFTGGTTDSMQFVGSDVIAPGEPLSLMYKLNSGYQMGAVWLMDNLTWAHILGKRDSDSWAFGAADMATVNTAGGPKVGTLLGKPVYIQDDIDALGVSVTTVMIGDPYFYTLVERRGLAIKRNPFLYQNNGQVGFFSTFRQGGKITIKEAFQGGYHPA